MKIAIIGAGIGGLSAAYDLARHGHQVSVFESTDYVGGLAAGFKEPHWDWSVERYYHHWFQTDRHILGLAEELNLRDKIFFPRPYTVMYHAGKWYPFDSITAALMFPGLGWGLDKIRFGLVGLYLRLTNRWQNLEKQTAHVWMQRWAGTRVYKTMWQPLLEGKFGPYYQQVNMAWLWARLKTRTTRLGTYQGGFQQFANDVASHLEQMNVQIVLSSPVGRIETNDSQGLTLWANGTSHHFDKILVTTSPGLLARMAPQLPPDYLEGLRSLKHMGAVVLVLALDHQLSEQGYYWYNIPKSAGFPFLALVEHTNFIPREHFGGDHIVYCGDYLPTDHPYFTLDKDEILEQFLTVLPKFNSNFDPTWVKRSWLFRTPYAQPVPLVEHARNVPSIPTPINGLYFASMSQVYPWDRGTNFAVEIGRKAAKLMLADGA